jgi:adhesin transport system outer membrane protein
MAERYVEETMKHARLQRDAVESIDKAWAARTLTADRISALSRQIASDRKVIVSYQKEYELGQRSLVDLLNAQNQLFNGLISLISTQNVAVFADYQLLAAMGGLIQYVKAPPPADAAPLADGFDILPTKLPPIILHTPVSGPEPMQVPVRVEPVPALNYANNTNALEQASGRFDERWNSVNDVSGWLANTTKWSAPASAAR